MKPGAPGTRVGNPRPPLSLLLLAWLMSLMLLLVALARSWRPAPGQRRMHRRGLHRFSRLTASGQ